MTKVEQALRRKGYLPTKEVAAATGVTSRTLLKWVDDPETHVEGTARIARQRWIKVETLSARIPAEVVSDMLGSVG